MQIYFLNINGIAESQFEDWFAAMDAERRDEVSRTQNTQKRCLRIAADHLRRKAISDSCGISPANITFGTAEKGKPFALNADVHFSVSHSGECVVCAVSDKEIGIDIEKIRDISLRAAEKFASADELEYIKSCKNGFFEIWTLKEAYFKCIGTGLGSDIKKVTFRINQNNIRCSENGFECSFYTVADGYICSVCQKV